MTEFIDAETLFEQAVNGGAYYVSSIVSSNGGSTNVHFRNTHSDKVAYIAGTYIIAEGNQNFYIHDTFDSVSDGSEIEIQNMLLDEENGSVDTGPFKAFSDSTYTATTSFPIGFSTGTGKNIYQIGTFPSFVESGRELIFEFDNQDSSQNRTFIGFAVITSY